MSDRVYASLWRRACALFIDIVIISLISTYAGEYFYVARMVLIFLNFAVYQTVTGQSIGKQVLGIHVIRANGEKITLISGIIRAMVQYFSTLIFFIGYFFIIFSPSKQALHDMLARTVVVEE